MFNYENIKPAGFRIHAFQVMASWVHLKGIEVVGVQVTITTHTQSECFDNQGSDNIYDKNNLGWGARVAEYLNLNRAASNAPFNSFTLPVTVNSSDFASIDLGLLTAPRQSNGSLPVNDCMRLLPSSDCIDKGCNVGLPYYGTAPDLGCFETGNYTG